MSDDPPWITDPKYGGMSEPSARKSHEAWVRQGRKVLPVNPPAESPAFIEAMKRSIEEQLRSYEEAIVSAAQWLRGWKRRQRQRGFKATDNQVGEGPF